MWKGTGKIIRDIGKCTCRERKTEKKDFYNGQRKKKGGRTSSR